MREKGGKGGGKEERGSRRGMTGEGDGGEEKEGGGGERKSSRKDGRGREGAEEGRERTVSVGGG